MKKASPSPAPTKSASRRGGRVPVAEMVESIVGCKWSVRLLGLVAAGCSRPSALLRACPGLSTKVMNERMRKFTRFEIAERSVTGDKPPLHVEYALTRLGREFIRILDEVRHLQESVDRQELSTAPSAKRPATPGRRGSRTVRPR